MESLETRAVLATFTVTTAADSGAGSLREAVSLAAEHTGEDTIEFAPEMAGQTIKLTTPFGVTKRQLIQVEEELFHEYQLEGIYAAGRRTALEIHDQTLTIDGAKAPGLTISGNGAQRILLVTPTGHLSLRNLTFAGGAVLGDGPARIDLGGQPGRGGAVMVFKGSLQITGCTFHGNSVVGGDRGGSGEGGAVYAERATTTIVNSTFTDNHALPGTGTAPWTPPNTRPLPGNGLGGAVFQRNGLLQVLQSTISANAAEKGTGIYSLGDNRLNLPNVHDNTATVVVNNSILGGQDASRSDYEVDRINYGKFTAGGSGNIIRNGRVFCHPRDTACRQAYADSVASTADPMLGPLTDNGGPTKTMLPHVKRLQDITDERLVLTNGTSVTTDTAWHESLVPFYSSVRFTYLAEAPAELGCSTIASCVAFGTLKGGYSLVLQNDPQGLNAGDTPYASQGLSAITPSVAIAFEIARHNPLASLYINGQRFGGEVRTGYWVNNENPVSRRRVERPVFDTANFIVGHPIDVTIRFVPAINTISVTMKDLVTELTAVQHFVNTDYTLAIGNTGYLGFTGSSTAVQTISNWSFKHSSANLNDPPETGFGPEGMLWVEGGVSSPALGRGDAGVVELPSSDQRGRPRLSSEGIIDIGAVQLTRGTDLPGGPVNPESIDPRLDRQARLAIATVQQRQGLFVEVDDAYRQLVDRVPLQRVVQDQWMSREHRTRQVREFYQQYLGRDADAAGLNHWVNLLMAGYSQQFVQKRILTSTEFANRTGGGERTVRALHSLLIGRDASQLELIASLAQLRSRGMSAVVDSLLGSREHRTLLVKSVFQSYLYRAPRMSELNLGLAGLLQLQSQPLAVEMVAAELLATDIKRLTPDSPEWVMPELQCGSCWAFS